MVLKTGLVDISHQIAGFCHFILARVLTSMGEVSNTTEQAMKNIISIGLMLSTLFIIGCQENVIQVDLTPPSSPRGLATATGDNQIEVSWLPNPEPDVAGYRVYVSTSYHGTYQPIGSTTQTFFFDRGSRNGYTYYYAVSAYDFNDNESGLSQDVAYDTPRPEGYNVVLRDYHTNPGSAGYDFSTYSVGPYDDQFTDVYFENYNGTLYFDVWEDTDIQDLGYTSSLYEIGEAPVSGWSPTKDALLIPGHTYVIRTWDSHYAKIRVVSLSSGQVMFDWAYQLQSDNTRLKQSAPSQRGTLTIGSGAKSRL